ncbi:MAG: hypothetical protein AB1847_17330, partial [bacterium]
VGRRYSPLNPDSPPEILPIPPYYVVLSRGLLSGQFHCGFEKSVNNAAVLKKWDHEGIMNFYL